MPQPTKQSLAAVVLAALALLFLLPALPARADGPPVYLTEWGGVTAPTGIDVDSAGNVYVADSGNFRVIKFDNDGGFPDDRGFDSGETVLLTGLAINSAGNIYLTDGDLSDYHVWKFDSITGTGVITWGGGSGQAEEQFQMPMGVAVDSTGNFYVADQGNHRVQIFDSTGTFSETWGFGVENGASVFQKCTSGCQKGLFGPGDGQFNGPAGIAVDFAGNVYISDQSNRRIQKFDSAGNFLQMWGLGVESGDPIFETCTVGCRAGVLPISPDLIDGQM